MNGELLAVVVCVCEEEGRRGEVEALGDLRVSCSVVRMAERVPCSAEETGSILEGRLRRLTLDRSDSSRHVAAEGNVTRRTELSYPHFTTSGRFGRSDIAPAVIVEALRAASW